MRYLVRRFTARTNKVRNSLNLPPTPSAPSTPVYARTPTEQLEEDPTETNDLTSKPLSTSVNIFEADQPSKKFNLFQWPNSFCGRFVLDPQGMSKTKRGDYYINCIIINTNTHYFKFNFKKIAPYMFLKIGLVKSYFSKVRLNRHNFNYILFKIYVG